MDHGSFDRLARLLGSAGSRRAAIGALLGTGLTGTLGAAEAAKKDRNKKRRAGRKDRGQAQVSAQAADCLNPGPSSNMNGCNYEGEDFSGQNLSSSSMVGTIFRNADLLGTDLSSSNMRGANFRGANLCGADLSSSTLRNTDFRGFAIGQGSGRQTNLAFADLSSSACGGILTNNRTFICGTTWCDGTVRNDSCPGGVPSDLCCTPCGAGEACVNNDCVAVCDEPATATSCDCRTSAIDGSGVCVNNVTGVGQVCSPQNPECPPGQSCAFSFCLNEHRCYTPCPSPDPCTCEPPTSCAGSPKCGETAAARRSSASGPVDKP